MRVTFQSLQRHMLNVINERYADISKTQEQLATGKRLLRPSDDPVDTSNDLKLKSRVKQLGQFKTNINDGLAFMSVTDTAMMSMNTLMQRLRELGIQSANDTLSGNERLYIEREVEQLFRQLVTLCNTNYKGDYVFAGTNSKIVPFPIESSYASTIDDYQDRTMAYYDGSGGPGTYQIRDAFDDSAITNIVPGSLHLSRGGTEYVEGTDFSIDYQTGEITIVNPALAVDMSDGGLFETGPNGYYTPADFKLTFDYVTRGKDVYGDTVTNRGNIYREIETGIAMPINIPGDELVENHEAGIDLIGTMVRFGEKLLENDRAGISASIGEMDTMFETVLAAQSKNGARMNRFETTLQRNELQYTETTRLHSELEDADLAEMASKFSLMETVYNAALKSAVRIIQPSLANFL